jgi:hypothetical protein
MSCSSKIVVFDLDETLGYFMELGMFWDALKSYINHSKIHVEITQLLFTKILNLYPEFLRPNITEILSYIKKKKEKNKCDKLMIYTNNQGPSEWAKYIINYFEEKVGYKIFDQIIGAFKVQGKRVELCRTSNLKNHIDFVRCTKIPENTQICFVDDVFYPDMSNDRIYYINVKPYTYDLNFNDMINRFLKSAIIEISESKMAHFNEYMLSYLNKYNYIYIKKTPDSQVIDEIISKKMLDHLRAFFKITPIGTHNAKTKKRRTFYNKTLKRH